MSKEEKIEALRESAEFEFQNGNIKEFLRLLTLAKKIELKGV